MAQTSYMGMVVAPSGHRLVVQTGTHAFTKTATTVTLTLHFKRLVAAQVSQGPIAVGGHNSNWIGAYIPWVSVSQYTNLSTLANGPYSGVVSRRSSKISGALFSYVFIGY